MFQLDCGRYGVTHFCDVLADDNENGIKPRNTRNTRKGNRKVSGSCSRRVPEPFRVFRVMPLIDKGKVVLFYFRVFRSMRTPLFLAFASLFARLFPEIGTAKYGIVKEMGDVTPDYAALSNSNSGGVFAIASADSGIIRSLSELSDLASVASHG